LSSHRVDGHCEVAEQTGINWTQFWQQALAGNWVAGCWLLLNLAKHFIRP